MVTNGLYLTPELLHQLVDAGMHAMTISLDGLEENHNWMRGNKDSFRAVSDAIDLLREEPNIVWDIVTCATEHNFSELPALRDFLIDKGVPSWRLLDVFPVGRAATTPEVLLSDKHYRQLLEFIRETRRKGSIRTAYGCEGFVGEFELDVRDYGFFCKAGITVGSVLIDGSISACSSIRSDYHQGNIYEDDFMDVWENRFLLYRDRKWMHKEDCGECNMFRYCKGSGMHLRDGDGKLLQCHVQRLLRAEHP
jgi:radical SAM protein with 4Fe4S-binding SPASM domain